VCFKKDLKWQKTIKNANQIALNTVSIKRLALPNSVMISWDYRFNISAVDGLIFLLLAKSLLRKVKVTVLVDWLFGS
jgi:hypothetical protein